MRLLAFALLLTLPAHAQSSPSPASVPSGTVSGHITMADTGTPARLARVSIEPAEDFDKAAPAGSNERLTRSNGVTSRLDGSYTIEHVPPGSYYVLATSPGYLSPLTALGLTFEQLDQLDESQRKHLRELLPRVTVSPTAGGTADVTLQRGAAISGTILYDDGSPAASLRVVALTHRKGKWVTPEEETGGTSTDDRGSYRVSGLPPGEYLVSVELQTGVFGTTRRNGRNEGMYATGGTSISLYGGDHVRAQDAQPFQLKPGEERMGEDLQVPLSQLHSVSGVLQAARDGHLINGGEIKLVFPDDKTSVTGTRLEHGDETFTLQYVLEGDYLLQAQNVGDFQYTEVSNGENAAPPTHTEEHALHMYGSAEVPIHVGSGDVDGLAIPVPEKGAKAATPSL